MIVAEIEITAAHGFTSAGFVYKIRFDNLDDAWKAYHEVVGLIDRREKHCNDLPKQVAVKGSANEISLPLDTIQSVGIMDFARANEESKGLKDAYPYMFAISR